MFEPEKDMHTLTQLSHVVNSPISGVMVFTHRFYLYPESLPQTAFLFIEGKTGRKFLEHIETPLT